MAPATCINLAGAPGTCPVHLIPMHTVDELLRTDSKSLSLPPCVPCQAALQTCRQGTLYAILQGVGSPLTNAYAVKVAKQQGEYIAKLLASGKAQPGKPIQGMKPFRCPFMTRLRPFLYSVTETSLPAASIPLPALYL